MENVMHVSREVIKFGNAANKADCRTQDLVQAPQWTSREASVKGTRIVKPIGDKGVGKSGSTVAEAVSERATVRSWRNW